MRRPVRVLDRHGLAGVAGAGEAEILAGRLADDGAAGIEDARDHGGVDLGHVALDHPAAVHVRHARDADVVLDADTFAAQEAGTGALDLAAPGPGVIWILFRRGPSAGGTRVLHRQARLGQLVEAV